MSWSQTVNLFLQSRWSPDTVLAFITGGHVVDWKQAKWQLSQLRGTGGVADEVAN